MTTLWRINKYPDLSGEGGRLGSARWHTRGKPVVYLAESPAGAMLERIVHSLDPDFGAGGNLPSTYTLLEIAVPDELAAKPLSAVFPVDWKEREGLTQHIGVRWISSRETVIARVPCAIMPRTWNYLLNPLHPDAAKVQIVEVIKERFDNRLFRFGMR